MYRPPGSPGRVACLPAVPKLTLSDEGGDVLSLLRPAGGRVLSGVRPPGVQGPCPTVAVPDGVPEVLPLDVGRDGDGRRPARRRRRGLRLRGPRVATGTGQA